MNSTKTKRNLPDNEDKETDQKARIHIICAHGTCKCLQIDISQMSNVFCSNNMPSFPSKTIKFLLLLALHAAINASFQASQRAHFKKRQTKQNLTITPANIKNLIILGTKVPLYFHLTQLDMS